MNGSTERQSFRFSNLDKPPYTIISTLPQRLAKIRHIHLDYIEEKIHVPPTEYNPKWIVNRKCSTCNLCHWLEHITRFMTALRKIEISLYPPGADWPRPTMNHAWVIRLLELQQRSKAVAKFNVVPNSQRSRFSCLPAPRSQDDVFILKLRKELTRLRESKDAVIEIPEA